MAKEKIGILHPKLARGGSEARALWILDALKDEYEVSLITGGKVDIQQLNKYYGTNLDPKEFSVIQVPLPFFLRKTEKFAALRGRLIQRYCQKIAPKFNLLISTYNPCDFKKRAIQFVADFSFDEELPDIVPKNWKRWYHRDTFLRKSYLNFCDWISPLSLEFWRRDSIVANSRWTAELIREKYGINAQVIYPPVIGNFPDIPYEERENGFVCIGRMVPEKRIDTIIKILGRIRKKGHDIHLHIIGGVGRDSYGRFLKKIFRKHQEWIFSEGWLDEKEKKEIITKHRFGISACKNEAFGITVAEMVKGGCIVFVPNGGGQTEIVEHTTLIYEDIEDAVRKIEKVINNSDLQDKLQKHLLIQGQKFSAENFKKGIKNMIERTLREKEYYEN